MPEWWTWADWLVLAVMVGAGPFLIAVLWWAERPLRPQRAGQRGPDEGEARGD